MVERRKERRRRRRAEEVVFKSVLMANNCVCVARRTSHMVRVSSLASKQPAAETGVTGEFSSLYGIDSTGWTTCSGVHVWTEISPVRMINWDRIGNFINYFVIRK